MAMKRILILAGIVCLVAIAALAQPVIYPGILAVIGSGTGTATFTVSGGSTGSADGPRIIWKEGGTDWAYMGTYSSIFGGGFSHVLALVNSGFGIYMASEPLEIGSPTGGMPAAGSVNISGVYEVNGSAGVTCSGTPTSSFASVGGVVTHC